MEKNKDNLSVRETVSINNMKLPEDLKELSNKQCQELCGDIRRVLVNTVSKNGGHLASNLGTVELTVALHKVFESPKDKIIWDVGHQAYTHKLLTGRLNRFKTLRQENGISGFPKPSESEHDACVSGHSSTSISTACGIAEAMKLDGNEHYAVAVIGDGAFTGGMAYEGLNNAGKSKSNIIIILNHNEMSISKNVGAFARYINNIRNKKKYINTKIAIGKTLERTPIIGKPIKNMITISKRALKSVTVHSTMFEDLGFVYLGPIDGHDIDALEEIFNIAKSYKQPVFVHVNTTKGKGYLPAEKNPGEYHGVSRFDVMTGEAEVAGGDSYSIFFGKELLDIAKKDDRICAVTAAMKYGTGLQYFANEFRQRFFDVGIAEQHAVTFSAGLAIMGKIPVFAVYSTFIQRAYDQIIHDIAIEELHVVLAIDRAGLVGEDGETHQGLFDIPMLTSIPNMVIYSPACYEELKLCLNTAIYDEKGVVCVRYPRGKDDASFDKSNINSKYILRQSKTSKILIITYGRLYNYIENIRNEFTKMDIYCDTLKLTRIFPIAEELINIALEYESIFFFEESESYGGISEHFSAILMENAYRGNFYRRAVNGFVKQASVKRCMEKLRLNEEEIKKVIIEKLEHWKNDSSTT